MRYKTSKSVDVDYQLLNHLRVFLHINKTIHGKLLLRNTKFDILQENLQTLVSDQRVLIRVIYTTTL